ncbi:ATPase, T2SS/T4P/T4SS family, partial [Pseudomonas aeruginosa]
NHQAINDVQFSTGLTTEAILVEDDKLGIIIEKLFENATDSLAGLDDVDLEGLDVGSGAGASQDDDSSAETDDAPVVRFVNKMLLDAIRGGSSDLHFEPYEKIYRVRFRTD